MEGSTPPAPAPVNPPSPDPSQQQPPAPPAPPAPAQPPAAPPDDKAARDAAFAEQRRENQRLADELQEHKDREAERERKEAEERGEHEKLAQQERERAEKAEAALKATREEALVKDAATELNFRNPADALALLPTSIDRSDPEAVKAGLTQLATDRDYLVATTPPPTPPPSGSPLGGGTPPGDAPLEVTAEQLRDMSPSAVAALPQEVVDKAMGRTR